MQVCANCSHFLVNPEEIAQQLGWCRRYPPIRRVFKRPQLDDQGMQVYDALGREVILEVEEAAFPSVPYSFYCGEWLPIGRKVHQDLIRPTAIYSFKPSAAQAIAEGIEKAEDHIAEAAGQTNGKAT